MNDNIEVPNEALRAHVSDHSFVLSLRKTHIRGLIAIANADREMMRPPRGSPDHFISAVHGLMRRGLILHRHEPGFARSKPDENGLIPISDFYRLTRAGWAVFDLIVEAGMAEAIDKKSSLRRLVA